MNLPLYELTTEYKILLERFNYCDEEEEEQFTAELDALDSAIATKADSIACYSRAKELEAQAYRIEAKRLLDKAERSENKAEWCKKYLAHCIGEGNKLKTEHFDIGWRKSQSVDFLPGTEFSEDLMRIKREPNKELIGTKLKAGEVIPGARLVTRQNLQLK